MADAVKLCKDCKHYVKQSDRHFDKCVAPQAEAKDYVRGEHPSQFCEIMRTAVSTCGPLGSWFSQREAA